MAKDALDAHARDELGFNEAAKPNPIQAAWASAVSFSVGAALPTLAAFLAPNGAVVIAVPAAALVFLVTLGAVGARIGRGDDRQAGAEGRLLGRAGHGGDGGDRRADWQGGLRRIREWPTRGAVRALRRRSARRDRAVKVVLLSRMNAHQGLDCNDEPLRVVDEVTINRLRRQSAAARPSRRATC